MGYWQEQKNRNNHFLVLWIIWNNFPIMVKSSAVAPSCSKLSLKMSGYWKRLQKWCWNTIFFTRNEKYVNILVNLIFLVKRHECSVIFSKSENWNFWAITFQLEVQLISIFACVNIFRFHCHLKSGVSALKPLVCELAFGFEIMIQRSIFISPQWYWPPKRVIFNPGKLLFCLNMFCIENVFLYNIACTLTRKSNFTRKLDFTDSG